MSYEINPWAPESIIPGKDAWKTLRKRNIVGNIQWYQDEPVLVLTPMKPRLGGGCYVIAESAIPKYVADHGRGPRYTLRAAAIAAARLGFDPRDRNMVTTIADCIYDWLPFLVECPPKPEILKRVIDEAEVSINGKARIVERVL